LNTHSATFSYLDCFPVHFFTIVKSEVGDTRLQPEVSDVMRYVTEYV